MFILVKAKVVLVRATKAYGDNVGIASLILRRCVAVSGFGTSVQYLSSLDT